MSKKSRTFKTVQTTEIEAARQHVIAATRRQDAAHKELIAANVAKSQALDALTLAQNEDLRRISTATK